MKAPNWTKALLSDNPFIGTPPMPWEEIIWADMSAQKTAIENRLQSALVTSPSSLILNYGPWGGGKTHAARYFSQEKVLERLCSDIDVVLPLSIIINIPRGAKSVIRAIYLDIIDAIGLERIGLSLRNIAATLEADFPKTLRALVKSQEFVSAMQLLAGLQPERGQQQMNLDTERPLSPTLKRYFLASATSSDLRELRLSRGIESGSDMLSILSAIFNLLLYSTSAVNSQYSEIILWFDEMEEIASLPGKEQITLTSTPRHK